MAVADMSAGNQDAVRPFQKSLEQEAVFSEDLGAVLPLKQVLMLTPGFPEEARRPLLWMAENCPAKSLLRSPPVISLSLLSLAADRSSK